MNADILINNIESLAKKNNISKTKALTESGAGKDFISNIKKGQTPSINKLQKIATYFNVSVDYLLGSSSPIPTAQIVDTSQMISIPVVGSVAAGTSCTATQNIVGYELTSPESLRSGYEYIYLKVKGDSMEPLLLEGDLVLVQLQSVVESGDYAVVIVDNEDGLVKKIVYGENYIHLKSNNPYYPVRKFEGDEMNRVRIVGKVVESKRKF